LDHPFFGLDQTGAPASLRLRLDGAALVANYRALSNFCEGATGAAVKADGYGLGAREVVQRLADEGCEDFFLAQWAEAAKLANLIDPAQISVLNGVQDADISFALALGAKPVLNTPVQVARWRAAGGSLCDVMLNTGMNRLGIGEDELTPDLLDGLDIDIVMSHLASADEDSWQNERQLDLFIEMSDAVAARRRSLSNSAGIMLGADYHFDLTRPGLALYGGVPCDDLGDVIRQVAHLEAQVLQVGQITAGDSVGYNATFEADRDMRTAVVSMGYADGYLRGFSNKGTARFDDAPMPVLGRISMDLIILDATEAEGIEEGDWVEVDYDLPDASRLSGLSQYELITGLSDRFHRYWVD
jgi:alanine racemase